MAPRTKPTGRHFNARLSMDDAMAIRAAHARREASMDDLAKKYGVSKTSIFEIIQGKTYRAG
jgi:AcrR family transcriptional regulator